MKIGLLMSGGDAPGMNAIVAGVQSTSCDLIAIDGGFQGILDSRFRSLPLVSPRLATQPGCEISTGRCTSFQETATQILVIEQLRKQNIDGLIVCGGNGSMAGARALETLGFPTVGIPVTIDGDIGVVEEAIGFATAAQALVEQTSALNATSETYGGRIFLLETLGAKCGLLPLTVGLAAGADLLLLPEVPTTPDEAAHHVKNIMKQKGTAIVVMGEGAHPQWKNGEQNYGQLYGDAITAHTGVRTRYTIAGYGLRGLNPCQRDLLLARVSAHLAVQALQRGCHGVIAGIRKNRFGLYPNTPEAPKKQINLLLQIARERGILPEQEEKCTKSI